MPTLMKLCEAIGMQPSAFATLTNISFDDNIRYSSSRGLVLKGCYDGVEYAVKFFTSVSPALELRYKILSELNFKFIPNYTFLSNELRVIEDNRFVAQPVLMSRWIDGERLSDRIKRLCYNNDKESLRSLLMSVVALFIELLSTDIVHGDIKFDNIMVDGDGHLTIIDWDSFYVPSLGDYPTTEIGTYDFQHPCRTVSDYGRRVDDYSMAIIVVTLTIFSEQPELLGKFKNETNILIPVDVINDNSAIFKKLWRAWQYYPLRRDLLYFLRGDSFEMPTLKDVLLRLSGKIRFNTQLHEMVDECGVMRRIVDRKRLLYGFIDEDGYVVIDTMYGDCTPFCGDVAGVRINSSWFFIDRSGCQVSDLYDYIRESDDGSFFC